MKFMFEKVNIGNKHECFYSHGILMKHVGIPGYCKNTKAISK